jgi:tRNA dimethylallyltransferase
MDVGTAKASLAERTRIRHHLIDVIGLRQSFDAAQFVQLANAALTDIYARGRIPVFCGGTGLYFQAFLRGLGDAPPANPRLRRELENAPLRDLLDELELKDPVTFQRIDRRNRRRVVRAVEVIRLTGRTFSEQRAGWDQPSDGLSSLSPAFFVLERTKEDLRRRIDERVDRMFAQGLVDETKALLQEGLRENQTASQALGYRQVMDFLNGALSLEDTIHFVKQRTRQYAKRQGAWFRRYATAQWISSPESEGHVQLVERLEVIYAQRV